MMIKPEEYPDLIKVLLRGDEFLIDFEAQIIRPLGTTDLHPQVVNYLIEEVFTPDTKTHKGGDPFLDNKMGDLKLNWFPDFQNQLDRLSDCELEAVGSIERNHFHTASCSS